MIYLSTIFLLMSKIQTSDLWRQISGDKDVGKYFECTSSISLKRILPPFQVTELERSVKVRMQEDDVVLARLSEESDYRWNQSKADRIVVVGLKSTEYPKGLPERKEFLSKKMRQLIEPIVGEVVYDIYPRPASLQNDRVPPFVIQFPTIKDCEMFKRNAYRDSLSYDELKGTGYQPCVTPTTRVRIEILRAIARKLTGEMSGYCPIYSMRPVLHIGPRQDGKVQTKETLTYIPAVQKYGNMLNVKDLAYAYRAVEDGFKGCLRQTFIILNETDRRTSIEEFKKQNNQQTRGTKRPGQDIDDGSKSKTRK